MKVHSFAWDLGALHYMTAIINLFDNDNNKNVAEAYT